jgi:hypothetical protein
MNASTINELVHQLDTVTTNAYSKLKSNLGKELIKKEKIPFPLQTILHKTFDLICTILIVASIVGIYLASGLHDWWIQMVGQIT